MELRLHGSRRHPEPCRYLVHLEIAPEPQQDDCALVGIEDSDEPVDLDACERGRERVRAMDPYSLVEFDKTYRPSPPKPVATDVHDDPIEPGFEALGLAEPTPGLPGADDRLLSGILGVGRVAEDVAGETEGVVQLPIHQLGERVCAGANLGLRRNHRATPSTPSTKAFQTRRIQTNDRRDSFSRFSLAA
jgi:hypothetical protein